MRKKREEGEWYRKGRVSEGRGEIMECEEEVRKKENEDGRKT